MIKINGKEYGFMMTVGASVQICKVCPEHKLSKLGSVLKGEYDEIVENVITIICALNGGYVASEALMGREAPRLTREMIYALPPDDFTKLQDIMISTIANDGKGEIKAKPKKGKKDATAATD